MRTTAIIRWTGKGAIDDLSQTVANLCRDRGLGPAVGRVGDSVIVSGGNPVFTADLLKHIPGAKWIAVGFSASSPRELREGASILAKRYLRPGKRFVVFAETTAGKGPASDYAGAANFAVLDAVKGVRIDESDPDVTFRVAQDGKKGVVGVQVRNGPGGIPSGKGSAGCLVSGGMHSAVVSWMALLMGYSVELVHAAVDEESVRSVARLYSELSHRVDPSGLSLRVLEGGNVADSIVSWARQTRGQLFGGFHAGCSKAPVFLGRVGAPLYLLPDEEYGRVFTGLSLKQHESILDWRVHGSGRASSKTFGGRSADTSGVLDGLR